MFLRICAIVAVACVAPAWADFGYCIGDTLFYDSEGGGGLSGVRKGAIYRSEVFELRVDFDELDADRYNRMVFAFREHVFEKYNVTLGGEEPGASFREEHNDGLSTISHPPECSFFGTAEAAAVEAAAAEAWRNLSSERRTYTTKWKWKFAGNSAAGNEVADDPPAGGDQADRHGALAIDSNKGGLYGWAVDYKTQAGAEERALNECGKNGGSCGLVMRFHNACAAYVADQQTGSTAYGWGWHETDRETAKGIAKTECVNRGGIRSRCITRVWGCTGSVGGGGGGGWTAPATPAGDVGVNASMHKEYWAYCYISSSPPTDDPDLLYHFSSVFRTTENQVTLAMQYDSHMRARHDHLGTHGSICTRSFQDDKAAAVEERDFEAARIKNQWTGPGAKTTVDVVFTHWAPP